MYSERILDLFKNPMNAGGLQGANGSGKYVDENCGDSVKIYLKINDNKVITEARFKTLGSVATIVASSAMCSCLLDCTIEEALNIDEERICEITGAFPEEKKYAIDFVVKAVKLAIDNYYTNLEKQLKKIAENKQAIKEEKPNKENAPKEVEPQVKEQVNERRKVSAAKAAFDELFDL